MNDKDSPQKNVRDEITEKMIQWRQTNPKATLTEIEEAVDAALAKRRSELVRALAETGEVSQEEAPDCPGCGQAMVKNGRKKRQLQTKEGQTIRLERQQWRCLGCGATLFPPG